MKSFAAGLLGALCISTVEGRQMHAHTHKHAIRRVTEVKQHLEMVYGKGLIGLYDDDGALRLTPQKLKAARRRPSQNYAKIGGIMMDQEIASAGLYGFVEGFQYKGLAGAAEEILAGDMVESNCFYAMYGLMDSVDVLAADFNNFIDPAGEIKWLNLIEYNPSHILNNFFVGYEMCEGYTQVERLMALTSLDFALLGQTLGTDITFLFSDGKAMKEKLMSFAEPCLDALQENAIDAATDIALDAAGQAIDDIVDDLVSGEQVGAPDQPDIDWESEGVDVAAAALQDERCQPNYYEMGKVAGETMSRLLMQKMEESRLP
jgi:hypothetical protein